MRGCNLCDWREIYDMGLVWVGYGFGIAVMPIPKGWISDAGGLG